jgi:hypothetical protein
MKIENTLHEKLLKLVKEERKITSQIIELLQELENSRAYLEWGYGNLFEYLVKGLGYSESLAYQRKAAIKICQILPEVKEKLDSGALSLTTLARASRVLNTKTLTQKVSLLTELENKSTREVDKILARISPEKVHASTKRRVNEQTIRLAMDFSEEEYQKLERLKALKSHQIKDIKELVCLLVDRELEKYNRTSKTPSKSINPRQIKTSIRNHLLKSANYKCQYPGCEQTHFLQIDHKQSVCVGGGNQISNLQVLCQSHNAFKFRNYG